jgi:tRNA threonylcarbamoyladenosine biosynthesis protein TsaB
MLLAIDTSSRMIGVALYHDHGVVSETIWSSANYHTMQLAPAVEQILKRAGLQSADVNAVAVAIGPGSFTGIRIGLALAKGLALACRIPLFGIPSLDVLVAAQPVISAPLAAILPAGRGRLAVGWYRAEMGIWISTGVLEVLNAEALAQKIETPTVVCGDLSEEDRRRLARKHKNVLLASHAWSVRRPSFLAELAWKRWQAGETDDPLQLAPIYLHHGDPIEA